MVPSNPAKSSFHKLPYEIQYMILCYAEAVDADTGCIGTNVHLSRVCQIWRDIVQSVLFSTIDIRASIENDAELDKFNGSNLELTEVIFRRNPILATYVRQINILFLAKDLDKRDSAMISTAMNRVWSIISLIAEPRVRRSNALIFEPRKTVLRICFLPPPVRHRRESSIPNPTHVQFPKTKTNLPSINVPVELELRDCVLIGRCLDTDVLAMLINHLNDPRHIKITFSVMDGSCVYYQETYPKVLKCLQALPSAITSLELDFRNRICNDRGELMRDIFESPIYRSGTGDRLNRVVRGLACRLKRLKYSGPITPEFFGELPFTYVALDNVRGVAKGGPVSLSDGRSEFVEKDKIVFTDLEELHVRFDMRDSFGDHYFDRGRLDDSYQMSMANLLEEARADGYLGVTSDSFEYLHKQNMDDPEMYTPRTELMGRLSEAYTDAICNRMPRLREFSIRDYVGVTSLVYVSDTKLLKAGKLGLIPRVKMLGIKDGPALYMRRYQPSERDLNALLTRLAGEQNIAVLKDNFKVQES